MNLLFFTIHTIVVALLAYSLSRKAHYSQGRADGTQETIKLSKK